MQRLPALLLALGLGLAHALAPPASAAEVTPAGVIAAAAPGDWQTLDPGRLMVMTLQGGRRVVILLDREFAPDHVARIRRLALAHWYDGLGIERVQDGYVTQWGDGDNARVLPDAVRKAGPAEYERDAAGLDFVKLGYRDTYAAQVGFVDGMPVAETGPRAWLIHCYGMVGVGRDLAPDTGNGAELYAVIGQAPRALDRNIALVGRVVAGMENLTALPRGTAAMGFYASKAERLPIVQVRMASALGKAERPALQMLKADSAGFRALTAVRANRHDSFYERPAGALDVCNALPPVRAVPGSGH